MCGNLAGDWTSAAPEETVEPAFTHGETLLVNFHKGNSQVSEEMHHHTKLLQHAQTLLSDKREYSKIIMALTRHLLQFTKIQ